MKKTTVIINEIELIAANVLQVITNKPAGFKFKPGNAAEVCINKVGCRDMKIPIVFTNLPSDGYLEFIVKTHPGKDCSTNDFLDLKKGDELMVNDVYVAFSYKREGVFIACGAGITSFISTFRYLKAKEKTGRNMLVFANKTKADIILENEFSSLFGDGFINILSGEKVPGYHHGIVNEDFLDATIADLDRQFYICGPLTMMDFVHEQLANLGVPDRLVMHVVVGNDAARTGL